MRITVLFLVLIIAIPGFSQYTKGSSVQEDISFSLNGGANGLPINPATFSGNFPDTLVLMFDGTNWVEISRKNIGL